MTTVAIPEWTADGLLPPIDSTQPTSVERAPYPVSLLDVVMRFSTSPARRRVLHGLLDYRAALHKMGLLAGFQWLDGSFMEQVEVLERRAPRDIDVVSFVEVPDSFDPSPADWARVEHDAAKAQYSVDSYFVELNLLEPEAIVKTSAYWYSMWSHRRNQAWKGYLRIDLNPIHDEAARDWLSQADTAEAQP